MKKLAASVVVLATFLIGCSASKGDVKAAAQATPTDVPIQFPSKLLGMQVGTENLDKQLTKIGDSYLDSLSLLGFRENKLLRATLQVGHFNSLAKPADPAFRATMIGQFGSSVPQELRLSETTVYLSPGQLQYQIMWFSEDSMYILTVRRDYPFTRTLLRRLVAISLSKA